MKLGNMKLVSLLVLSAISGASYAQATTPSTVPAPMVAAPVAAAASPLLGTTINPFTGKPTDIEDTQLMLEKARLRTALLEEAQKQLALTADADMLPKKKALETATLETGIAREASARAGLKATVGGGSLPALPTPVSASAPTASKQIVTKNKQPVTIKSTKKVDTPVLKAESKVESVAPAAALAVATPVGPQIQEVQSIVDMGTRKSVLLLTQDGRLASFEDGADSVFGKIEVKDSSSVSVGSTVYRVHNATLGRFAVEKIPETKDGKVVSATVTANLPAGVAAGAIVPVPGGMPSVPASFSVNSLTNKVGGGGLPGLPTPEPAN